MLTPKRLALLRAIYAYAKHYHAWPSITDLDKRVGYARRAVHALTELGFVVRFASGGEGGQMLTDAAYDLLKRQPPVIHPQRRRLRNHPHVMAWVTRRQKNATAPTASTLDQTVGREPQHHNAARLMSRPPNAYGSDPETTA